MRPISIWLHCRLSGCGIDRDYSVGLLLEHLTAASQSRLLDAADNVNIGVGDLDYAVAQPIVSAFVPRAKYHVFDSDKRGELPTLCALREWLKGGSENYVCYTHLKCVTRRDALCRAWRMCMLRYVVLAWPLCLQRLEEGADTVGCHWLTPECYPKLVASPYWGGNYWWAASKFLATLPAIPDHAKDREAFFLAEKWVGMGPTRPRIFDFHATWPSMACVGYQTRIMTGK